MNVRIGVIGTGNIGTSHARDLALSVSGSTVTTLYDADLDRAARLAAELGSVVAGSAQEVVDAHDVDAIVIASPDAMHPDQVLACLAAGKPTLCEKPLAPVESDARAVVDAEVETGRRLIMMGFMRRFDAGYGQLKAQLSDGLLGEALLVHNIHRNTSAPYGLSSAATLTNMAIHELDIMRWLLDDEYQSVTVLSGRPSPATPEGEQDPLMIILRTASGVLVDIEAFVNARYGYDVSCQVTGSSGSAVMGDGSYVTRSAAGLRGVDVPELWLGRFQDAYRRQLQAWVDHLRGRGPAPGASAWDGYVATLTANRGIESLRSGRTIDITLPERPALYA